MDRSPRRPGDRPEDELPPDPWAGLAEPLPPPVPHQAERPTDAPSPGSASEAAPTWHPAGQDRRADAGRSWFAHPGVWVALTVVALLALIGAWLERPTPPPSAPSPGSVQTAPVEPHIH